MPIGHRRPQNPGPDIAVNSEIHLLQEVGIYRVGDSGIEEPAFVQTIVGVPVDDLGLGVGENVVIQSIHIGKLLEKGVPQSQFEGGNHLPAAAQVDGIISIPAHRCGGTERARPPRNWHNIQLVVDLRKIGIHRFRNFHKFRV